MHVPSLERRQCSSPQMAGVPSIFGSRPSSPQVEPHPNDHYSHYFNADPAEALSLEHHQDGSSPEKHDLEHPRDESSPDERYRHYPKANPSKALNLEHAELSCPPSEYHLKGDSIHAQSDQDITAQTKDTERMEVDSGSEVADDMSMGSGDHGVAATDSQSTIARDVLEMVAAQDQAEHRKSQHQNLMVESNEIGHELDSAKQRSNSPALVTFDESNPKEDNAQHIQHSQIDIHSAAEQARIHEALVVIDEVDCKLPGAEQTGDVQTSSPPALRQQVPPEHDAPQDTASASKALQGEINDESTISADVQMQGEASPSTDQSLQPATFEQDISATKGPSHDCSERELDEGLSRAQSEADGRHPSELDQPDADVQMQDQESLFMEQVRQAAYPERQASTNSGADGMETEHEEKSEENFEARARRDSQVPINDRMTSTSESRSAPAVDATEEESFRGPFTYPSLDDNNFNQPPDVRLEELIVVAICSSPKQALTWKEICDTIAEHSSYYTQCDKRIEITFCDSTQEQNVAAWRTRVQDSLHQYDYPTTPIRTHDGDAHCFTIKPGAEWTVLNKRYLMKGKKRPMSLFKLSLEARFMIYQHVLHHPLPYGSGWSVDKEYLLQSNRAQTWLRNKEANTNQDTQRLTTSIDGWELHTRTMEKLLAITLTSKEVRGEALPIFYRSNWFYFPEPKILGRFLNCLPNRIEFIRNIVLNFDPPLLGHECKRSLVKIFRTKLRYMHIIIDEKKLLERHKDIHQVRDLPGVKILGMMAGLDEVTYAGDYQQLKTYLKGEKVTHYTIKDHSRMNADGEDDDEKMFEQFEKERTRQMKDLAKTYRQKIKKSAAERRAVAAEEKRMEILQAKERRAKEKQEKEQAEADARAEKQEEREAHRKAKERKLEKEKKERKEMRELERWLARKQKEEAKAKQKEKADARAAKEQDAEALKARAQKSHHKTQRNKIRDFERQRGKKADSTTDEEDDDTSGTSRRSSLAETWKDSLSKGKGNVRPKGKQVESAKTQQKTKQAPAKAQSNFMRKNSTSKSKPRVYERPATEDEDEGEGEIQEEEEEEAENRSQNEGADASTTESGEEEGVEEMPRPTPPSKNYHLGASIMAAANDVQSKQSRGSEYQEPDPKRMIHAARFMAAKAIGRSKGQMRGGMPDRGGMSNRGRMAPRGGQPSRGGIARRGGRGGMQSSASTLPADAEKVSGDEGFDD